MNAQAPSRSFSRRISRAELLEAGPGHWLTERELALDEIGRADNVMKGIDLGGRQDYAGLDVRGRVVFGGQEGGIRLQIGLNDEGLLNDALRGPARIARRDLLRAKRGIDVDFGVPTDLATVELWMSAVESRTNAWLSDLGRVNAWAEPAPKGLWQLKVRRAVSFPEFVHGMALRAQLLSSERGTWVTAWEYSADAPAIAAQTLGSHLTRNEGQALTVKGLPTLGHLNWRLVPAYGGGADLQISRVSEHAAVATGLKLAVARQRLAECDGELVCIATYRQNQQSTAEQTRSKLRTGTHPGFPGVHMEAELRDSGDLIELWAAPRRVPRKPRNQPSAQAASAPQQPQSPPAANAPQRGPVTGDRPTRPGLPSSQGPGSRRTPLVRRPGG